MENDKAWVSSSLGNEKGSTIVRMNYADRPYGQGYHAWVEPFAIVPHWNMRGAAQTGSYASGAAQTGSYASGERQRCKPVNGTTRCVYLDWHEGWFPYSPARPVPEHWHGSLLNEKRDGSGLLYRRNRYYDPSSSRFTQEDPIGLAGGLNVYGFAAGDPVTYSDPYGLCKDKDRICERFVSQLRELARSTDNPNFGVAADVLDETRNRVVFVRPDDRRLGGAMASTATGCGFLGLGRCVYLRNDLGPGDQVAAVAHEAHYHVRHGVALPDGVQVDDRYQFDLSIQKSLPAHYQPTTVLNRDRLRALGVLQ